MSISKSAVSDVCKDLDQEVTKFRNRPIEDRHPFLTVDATYYITDEDARNMAKETRGYSFACQVLGYLTWNAKARWSTVLSEYRQYLEEFVYNKEKGRDKQCPYRLSETILQK